MHPAQRGTRQDKGHQRTGGDARDLPERLHAVLEAIYAAFGLAWDDPLARDASDNLADETIYLADSWRR